MNHATIDEARAAKAKAVVAFQDDPTVVGVGITRIGEGFGVKLNLDAPPRPDSPIPGEFDGVPVRVEVVARPHKL
jgi:hypothetical protein